MSYFSYNPRRATHTTTKLVLAVCASLMMPASFAAGTAPTSTVEITKFAFAPKEITVAPGTKIVWTNRDGAPHTVTANDKSFASKGLDTDDKYEYTFSREGTFTYYCTV